MIMLFIGYHQRKLFFSICYLVSLAGVAQIDEIKEILKSKPHTEETAIWLCDTAFTFAGNDLQITQQIAELALEKARQLDSDLAKARAYHVIGISYYERGVYERALESYIDALKYYEKIGNRRGQALIKINIGIIYGLISQPERAKNYLLESIKILETLNDSLNLGKSYSNVAVNYSHIGLRDSAIFYYNKALVIRQAQNDSIGIASTFNNIANIYVGDTFNIDVKTSEAQFAYKNFVEALKFINEGDRDILLSKIYTGLGRTLSELGRTNEALAYLNKGLDLGIRINSKTCQQLCYRNLKWFYQRQGDYKAALDYFIKESNMDKELRSAEVAKQIDQLNIKYETERKEKEIVELEQLRIIDQGVRNLLIMAIVSVTLLAILLILYVSQKRRKDKLISNLRLQKLTTDINAKNKEITSYTLNFLQKIN
ncbi:MAG: tetratricopeptide repeat protein [Ekhidna sp.]